MVIAAVSGLIGALTLYYYYRLLQSKWPNNYFTATQYVDYVVSIGAIRYSLFRLAPPYVVIVVVGVAEFASMRSRPADRTTTLRAA